MLRGLLAVIGCIFVMGCASVPQQSVDNSIQARDEAPLVLDEIMMYLQETPDHQIALEANIIPMVALFEQLEGLEPDEFEEFISNRLGAYKQIPISWKVAKGILKRHSDLHKKPLPTELGRWIFDVELLWQEWLDVLNKNSDDKEKLEAFTAHLLQFTLARVSSI